jgi:[protein-PII] uridylyltransferase
MPIALDELALAHLSFTPATTGAERIAGCKAFLKDAMADLRMSHDLGANGLAVANGRSDIIDILITRLFDHAVGLYAQMTGPTPAAVSMLALGGYGRRELAPWSDVDVMFLYPTKSKPAVVQPFQAHLTQEVLYPLWDCSLKVGHSTRTVEEVFVQANKEIMTKTALLESRYVAGSAALCDSFLLAYRNYYTTDDPKGYILSRLEDQSARRAKYGNTVFNQEPDIKNGVGCLRDYQNTLWMARVKLGIDKMEDLAAGGHLSFVEVAEFNRAYDFLLRVRNELHFESVRPTDILNLDSQPRVALNLGYTQEALLARVEWFMQDYYRCAQTIFQTSKAVESRLALAIGRTSSGAKIPDPGIDEDRAPEEDPEGRRLRGPRQRALGRGPDRLPGGSGAPDPGVPALPAARLHAGLPPGAADQGSRSTLMPGSCTRPTPAWPSGPSCRSPGSWAPSSC